jgi:hypothetical protein
MNGYATLTTAARRLGLTIEDLEQLIEDGRLECHLIAGKRPVPVPSLHRRARNAATSADISTPNHTSPERRTP